MTCIYRKWTAIKYSFREIFPPIYFNFSLFPFFAFIAYMPRTLPLFHPILHFVLCIVCAGS